MNAEIVGMCSLAPKQLLDDLSADVGRELDVTMRFVSGGGVQIVQQVRDGAEADLVVLSEDAITALAANGLVLADSVRSLFVSETVMAVPSSAVAPELATEDHLRHALLAARGIAYSTGPSGVALLALIERWGLTAQLAGGLVQAPSGVPVGNLLLDGKADVGFQQRSELMNFDEVTVIGPLPGEAAIRSVFSGALLATARHHQIAASALRMFGSGKAAAVIVECGMTPALGRRG